MNESEKFLLYQLPELIFTLGRSYIVNHTTCLADFEQKLLSNDFELVKQRYCLLIGKIDDLEYQSLLSKLFHYLSTLHEIDNEIIDAYCKEFNISMNSRKRIKKKVYDLILQKKMKPPNNIIRLSEKSISIIPKFNKTYELLKKVNFIK
jgi:hypothetical protein